MNLNSSASDSNSISESEEEVVFISNPDKFVGLDELHQFFHQIRPFAAANMQIPQIKNKARPMKLASMPWIADHRSFWDPKEWERLYKESRAMMLPLDRTLIGSPETLQESLLSILPNQPPRSQQRGMRYSNHLRNEAPVKKAST